MIFPPTEPVPALMLFTAENLTNLHYVMNGSAYYDGEHDFYFGCEVSCAVIECFFSRPSGLKNKQTNKTKKQTKQDECNDYLPFHLMLFVLNSSFTETLFCSYIKKNIKM